MFWDIPEALLPTRCPSLPSLLRRASVPCPCGCSDGNRQMCRMLGEKVRKRIHASATCQQSYQVQTQPVGRFVAVLTRLISFSRRAHSPPGCIRTHRHIAREPGVFLGWGRGRAARITEGRCCLLLFSQMSHLQISFLLKILCTVSQTEKLFFRV